MNILTELFNEDKEFKYILTKVTSCQIFTVTREVKDKVTGTIQSLANYAELGELLIVVTFITLLIPMMTVFLIQKTKFKTEE